MRDLGLDINALTSYAESGDQAMPAFAVAKTQTAGLVDALAADDIDLLLIDGDCSIDGDLTIDSHRSLLVKGHLRARNIIVFGHLFVVGGLDCKVLFGASGNDNMTHVGGRIRAKTVAENGHYTLAETDLRTDRLLSIHNEITAKGKVEVMVAGLDRNVDARASSSLRLHPSLLDAEGHFDEEAFLQAILQPDYSIFAE
jgi:hypothetical protein